MQAHILRLCVLFEDLKREHCGATAYLDEHSATREAMAERYYHIRRALGTLFEMSGAIQQLNANTAFDRIKTSMSTGQLDAWTSAFAFFKREHGLLKDWRDEMGGHFSSDTASYILDSLHPDTAGCIEIHEVDGPGPPHNVRMGFAFDLIAEAMGKGDPNADFYSFVTRRLEFALNAFGHAAQAVHVLVQAHLWRRFGS